MKKKPVAEPIISPQILAMARKSVEPEKRSVVERCAVCGSTASAQRTATQPAEEEVLCWVCRRLKISAWRDSDQQVSAQE
jgi:hypothetical protein